MLSQTIKGHPVKVGITRQARRQTAVIPESQDRSLATLQAAGLVTETQG